MPVTMRASHLAKIGGPEGVKVPDQVPRPVTSKGFIDDRMTRYGKEALDRFALGKWVFQKHDRLYSLEDVEQAHRDVENRGTVGKLLIKI